MGKVLPRLEGAYGRNQESFQESVKRGGKGYKRGKLAEANRGEGAVTGIDRGSKTGLGVCRHQRSISL